MSDFAGSYASKNESQEVLLEDCETKRKLETGTEEVTADKPDEYVGGNQTSESYKVTCLANIEEIV